MTDVIQKQSWAAQMAVTGFCNTGIQIRVGEKYMGKLPIPVKA